MVNSAVVNPNPMATGNVQDHSAGLGPDDTNPSQLDASTETMIEENAELDDFYQMGKYMYIVCAFAELMFFILVSL